MINCELIGPPGTGKTFVGTYAMRVLLNNFDLDMGPIVCICQTNHGNYKLIDHVTPRFLTMLLLF